MDIRRYIDNTLLRPNVTEKEMEEFIRKSVIADFYAVCINPVWVRLASTLAGDDIKVCSVVGFPLGESSKELKLHEAQYVLEEGAEEIDVVMSISSFKSGNLKYVYEELTALRRLIDEKIMKVIVETAYLSPEEKRKALEVCIDCGADFIKTSSGFAPEGAKLEDVKLFKSLSKGKIKVKASGGIRDYETALAFIEVGADRIGTSNGFAILNHRP